MKYCKSIAQVLGLMLAFVVAATAADAPTLTFKFTTVNVPGAVATTPSGVNNLGVTVGGYQDKKLALHGYILDGKKLTRVDHPQGTNTACSGINPNGAIAVVGSYTNSKGIFVGFLYRSGKFTDIPGPAGALSSGATSINDAGDIVGFYTDAKQEVHGFLLMHKTKTYASLDVPGALGTEALGINNKGDIVLFWVDSTGSVESSFYNGKTYKTINVPGALGSYAQDLNSAGDVVYQWMGSDGLGHGALLQGAKYYKFDDPKGLQTYGGGINDHRIIVGGYQAKSSGLYQGYKASY